MTNTVSAVAAARNTARYHWPCRFLNASGGPYADEERPSAPRPTQARKATSAMRWNRPASPRSRGRPTRARHSRPSRVTGRVGSMFLFLLENLRVGAERDDGHRQPLPLQPPLHLEGGLVVQNPLPPALPLPDQLAAEEHHLGVLLGEARAAAVQLL